MLIGDWGLTWFARSTVESKQLGAVHRCAFERWGALGTNERAPFIKRARQAKKAGKVGALALAAARYENEHQWPSIHASSSTAVTAVPSGGGGGGEGEGAGWWRERQRARAAQIVQRTVRRWYLRRVVMATLMQARSRGWLARRAAGESCGHVTQPRFAPAAFCDR